MKKLALILTLITVAAGAAAAEQVSLMLEANLQDPNPQMVSLRDAANCRYVGTLQPSTGWSVTITKKICEDGVISPVSLVVPLRKLKTEPGYPAGSVVLAHSSK